MAESDGAPLMRICGSDGAVHDFAGPYTIGIDDMMCGPPKKVWKLELERGQTAADFDRAVAHGDAVYRQRMHNLFCDNCHSHVACCLNEMNYLGRSNWNMVTVFFYLSFYARYTSTSQMAWTYLPFAICALLLYWGFMR